MKLALVGWPIQHSLSPKLYQEILGHDLERYDLLPFEDARKIPSLEWFAREYDGINITSPYKRHFLNQIPDLDKTVELIGAINTISFSELGLFATNTDMIAVSEILDRYANTYPLLHLILLGDGVMANMTELVCRTKKLSYVKLSRKIHGDISKIDLIPHRNTQAQNLIINTCSRDYIFNGNLSQSDIFWDYNYSFDQHMRSIPGRAKAYHDGQEMLYLQALAAVRFWRETNPKLKC